MGSGGKRVRKNTKKSKAPSSGKNKREELIVVAPKGKERRSHPGAVSGLTNLGNTCFFNAVMQNMAHSYHFRTKLSSLVKSPAYHTELRHPTSEKVVKVNVTQKPGELITNLSNFLSEMQKGGSVLNPRPVFQVICKKSSRFSGYNQQDSQELLRYFLDSLRSEETHRIKHAILTSYGAGAGQKTSFTDQTKSDIRILGMQALSARTFVDDVFGGMLLSTVKCAECANCTTMKESFLDLSLPIAEDKASRDTLHSSHQQDKRKRDTISDGNSQLGKTYSPKKDGDYEQRLSKYQKKKMEREARKSAKKTKKTPKLSPGPVSNSEEGIADDTHQDDILPVDPATGESISEKTRTESQHMLSPETAHVGLQQEHSQDTTHVGLEERPASENICIESCEPATLDAELHEPILEAEPSSNTELSPGTTTQINSCEPSSLDASDTKPSPEIATQTESYEPATHREPHSEHVSEATHVLLHQPALQNEPADANTVAEEESPSSMGGGIGSSYASKGPELDKDGVLMTQRTPTTIAQVSRQDDGMDDITNGARDMHIDETTNQDLDHVNSNNNGDSDKQDLESQDKPREEVYDKNSVYSSLQIFCTPEHLTGDNKFACAVCTRDLAESGRRGGTQQGSLSEKGRGEAGNRGGEADGSGDEGKGGSEDGGSRGEEGREEDGSEGGGEDGGSGSEGGEDGGSGSEGDGGDEDGGSGSEGHGGDEDGGSGEESVESATGEENVQMENDTETCGKEKVTPSKIAFCDATKQLLIQTPPLALTLHLKRFSQQGRKLRKNSKYISFPSILDLRPFCTDECESLCDSNGRLLYFLHGLVEHAGGMQGGHYVAYVKSRTQTKDSGSSPELKPSMCHGGQVPSEQPHVNFDLSSTQGEWFYASDSHVKRVTEAEVMKSQAYLLFYERVPFVQ